MGFATAFSVASGHLLVHVAHRHTSRTSEICGRHACILSTSRWVQAGVRQGLKQTSYDLSVGRRGRSGAIENHWGGARRRIPTGQVSSALCSHLATYSLHSIMGHHSSPMKGGSAMDGGRLAESAVATGQDDPPHRSIVPRASGGLALVCRSKVESRDGTTHLAPFSGDGRGSRSDCRVQA